LKLHFARLPDEMPGICKAPATMPMTGAGNHRVHELRQAQLRAPEWARRSALEPHLTIAPTASP
jgi:hypothetical protein